MSLLFKKLSKVVLLSEAYLRYRKELKEMYEDQREFLEQEIFRGSAIYISYILGFSSQKYKKSLSLSVVRVGLDTNEVCYDLGGVGERPSISLISYDSWF